MSLLLDEVRSDFPILEQRVHGKPLIYLDSAATSQKPRAVIDAITHFYARENGTVHRAVYHLAAQATEKYNRARETIRSFLNAKASSEIVFTRGTTESINLIARTYPFQEGDEILLTEMEHHSNIVPWQLIAKEKKLKIRYLPINDDAELILPDALSPRTRLVSIAHTSNATGTLHPIKEIVSLARKANAHVFLDAAQSAAHIPLDVQALDVDFLAFSGHKAFGPTGIGVLYGKYDLLKELAPLQGGGDMIERVTLETTTFQEPPLKFEAGTPMIAQAVGLAAALHYIEELGLERIHAYEGELTAYTLEKLSQVDGLRFIGAPQMRGPIVSFSLEGIHHLDLATLLDLEGIAIRTGHACAQPLMDRFQITGINRVSLAPFNTFEEIDHLTAALKCAQATLRT